MKKTLLLLILILTSFGCKKLTEDQVQPESKIQASDTVKKNPIEADTGMKIFEGIYSVNINTSSFRDCKSPYSLYWLSDKTGKLKGMFEKIFPEKNVYHSVVIKVKGELMPTEEVALSDKYPQTLNVYEVILLEKKNSANTCVPYEFWGFGKDPDWFLEISKNENIIELNDAGEKKSYYFFYDEPDEENGMIIYKNYNKIQGQIIEIYITKEKCYDKMLDKYYDYSVSINLTGDKHYSGCCMKGSGRK